ncbi:class I SAM-dependent methyltransferase, partial [bacterium]|nr:class I SAM-dependent methyltransferase [bacterium]
SPKEPVWNNGFFPAIDAIALFGLVSTLKPKIYLEVGSGHSTRIVAKAKALNSPETRIISIDPMPRAEIDELCDEVVRKPLEECDLSLFDQLSENDILFFDGSHRVLQNSDNEVLFFDIIPRLKRNIYIHLHDIFWPFDYPDEWAKRMYSEQYVLGGMLLYGQESFEVVLPNTYISWCTDLLANFQRLWDAPELKGIGKEGSSFWLKKKVDG